MLIAAAFAGYFTLADKSDEMLSFVVANVGLVVSLSWCLVNRGSKYWQSNWERHVDTLEDREIGPLYKTILAKRQFSLLVPWDGYPYSVSKVNQLVSLYILIVWIGLWAKSYPGTPIPKYITNFSTEIFALITGAFLILLIWKGKTGEEGREREIDFVRSHQDRDDIA